MITGRTRRRLVAVPVCAAAIGACSFGPGEVTYRDTTALVVVVVLDERGEPVSGARLDTARVSSHAGNLGVIEIGLSQPVAGVLTAPGKLPEPVALDPRDELVSVTMLDRNGPAGERIAIHFGGDTMLGRRYQQPNRNDTPVVDDGPAARALVRDLAAMFGSADASIANLESVVGDLPDELAYPGKNFLIQSPPLVLAALDELGVDLVTLGNNHAYDWGDAGVEATLAALGDAGIPATGASLDEAGAADGALLDVAGRSVGLISMTTVNGDAVNTGLLDDDRPADGDTPAWQSQPRSFGFGSPGQPGYIAVADRTAGQVWGEFVRLEPQLTSSRVAELWSAIRAPDAYPELQDWVARRGHGGAAAYDRERMIGEIGELRDAGAGVVVVQLHAGFQYAAAPSESIRAASRAAIDAGADLVVSHHPHVLQGIEWYRGKLIAYSLGNLLFDQNFHVTTASAFLRVVIDPGGLVEARLIPLVLSAYSPLPATGEAAARIIDLLAARSSAPAYSARVDGLDVRSVVLAELPEGFEPAGVVAERGTARLTDEPEVLDRGYRLDPGTTAPLACRVVAVGELPAGVEYGVDLFGWGSFDDALADRRRSHPAMIQTPSDEFGWELVNGDEATSFDDAIRLSSDPVDPVAIRTVSLLARQEHEWWLPDESGPADAPPSYTLALTARRDRGETPIARFVAYRVADEDSTRFPTSRPLHTIELRLEVADDGAWHELELDLPAELFEPVDGDPVDGMFVYLETPPAFRGTLDLDDVRLYEWRAAPSSPIWVAADALRSDQAVSVTVPSTACADA